MEKVNFKPLSDIVILDIILIEPKQSSNIIVPDTVNRQESVDLLFDKHPFQAIVIAVGPGFSDTVGIKSMTIKPGDHVYMKRHPTFNEKIIINKKVYGYLRQPDILGILIK